MTPAFIIECALGVAIIVSLGLVLRAVNRQSAPETSERLKNVEAELSGLRDAKAEVERRLAAEERSAARLPILEGELSDLRDAKAATDRELSSLRDAKAEVERRLAAEERSAARLPALEQEIMDLREGRSVLEQELSRSQQLLAEARATLQEREARLPALEQESRELGSLRAEHAKTAALLVTRSGEISQLKAELAELTTSLREVRSEAAEVSRKLATAEEKLAQELKHADEKLAVLTDARAALTNEFRALASSIMTEHGETFTRQNREQVENILAPLRDRLAEFQQGLQNAHVESAKERATLVEKIASLTELSTRASSETENLTRALKGEAQKQGAWGEMILATILERSGLREGEEYVQQESHTGHDGSRLRPDVIINLPGGQRIVIDSKVSLTAFEQYVNAASDIERASALARHIASIRNHIRTLRAKEYHSAVGSSLDYVIMFIPIEGALAAALQEQPELTSAAAEANVAIATPTTLMIALRTVANVWQVERRNRNAEEIAERAGKIYDKFVGFIEDMKDLGGRLERAQTSYHTAMAKLSTGKGNVVRQVELLKDLGARASKSIPATLLEDEAPQGMLETRDDAAELTEA